MSVRTTYRAILIGVVVMSVAPPGVFPAKEPTNKQVEYVESNTVSSSKGYTKSTTPCPRWSSKYGCGRTPARTKPPPTTPNPNEKTTLPPTTRRPGGFRQPCNMYEESRAACLNDGKCFTLELMGERTAHCHCHEMYKGHRCEVIDSDIYVFSADKVEKAGIAAGVVAIIIIITVIIVYLVIKKRNKRKRETLAENGDANGHASKLLENDPDKGVNYNDIEMAERKKKCLNTTEI